MILQCRMFRTAHAIRHYYETHDQCDVDYLGMLVTTLVKDMLKWEALFHDDRRELSAAIQSVLSRARFGNGHYISMRSYDRLTMLIAMMKQDGWDDVNEAKFPILDKAEDNKFILMRADKAGVEANAVNATDLVAMFVPEDAVAFSDASTAGAMTYTGLLREMHGAERILSWLWTREELLRKYEFDEDCVHNIRFETDSLIIATHSATREVDAWKQCRKMLRGIRH